MNLNLPEKVLLVGIGLTPYVFLIGNATRKIAFPFLHATVISAGGGALLLYHVGMGRHPHVSIIFQALFFLWPVALIVAKTFCARFSWKQLWLSVPIMSWLTVNTFIAVDYPVNGGGGGLAMLVNLCIGWIYLIPLFGILHLLYRSIAFLVSRKDAKVQKEEEG